MIPLAKCKQADINIPSMSKVEKSKSAKLMKIKDMWFFIQKTKHFTNIYEVSTQRLIMCPGIYSAGLNKLVKDIDIVRDAVALYKKEHPWGLMKLNSWSMNPESTRDIVYWNSHIQNYVDLKKTPLI